MQLTNTTEIYQANIDINVRRYKQTGGFVGDSEALF
jgi:hypothetical protein